ncbi:MAG: hypothetical protein PHT07_10270 [Paludibacter sp.]|nr:hypothetical protein [Paludibacter sp.]
MRGNQDCEYNFGFKCLSQKDSEFLCKAFPEFAFHFDRCVGTTGKEFAYIYEPNGSITLEDFNQSVKFVKVNLMQIKSFRYHHEMWVDVITDLKINDEPIQFSCEPISFVIESFDEPNLIFLYDRIIAHGSRTYGITARGKLVPLSHGAEYKEIPYNIECFKAVRTQIDLAYIEYKKMKENDVIGFFTGFEPLNIRDDFEFKKKYPSGFVDVVVVEKYLGGTAFIDRVVGIRYGSLINKNGNEIRPYFYWVYQANPNIDCHELCIDYEQKCHTYKKASGRYSRIIKKAQLICKK